MRRYNGRGNSDHEAYDLVVDDSGNVYVTGYSNGTSQIGSNDYATIKYVQNDSVVYEPDKKEVPSQFTLSQNYPNPFNQTTKIEFALKNSDFVSLNIYDILGRKVRTLVTQDLSLGHKSVLWYGKDDSGNDVASGTCFYRIKVRDFSETKKLVLLK